jgi:hypothetical protein
MSFFIHFSPKKMSKIFGQAMHHLVSNPKIVLDKKNIWDQPIQAL